MAAQRHILIGDVHACADALFSLLDACGRTADDEVVCVGDLVDRGPDPASVVRFFMDDPNACAVMGNHEDKHVRIRAGELPPGPGHLATQLLLGDLYDEALDYFASLPLSLTRAGHFVCHAGVVPDVALDEQPRQALLRGKMPWMKNIFDVSDPWWSHYEGDTPIVYGHLSTRDGGVRRVGNTWGIDTGAGAGGRLTALILPEQRVVSVPAPSRLGNGFFREHAAALARLEEDHARHRAHRRRRASAAKPSKKKPPIVVDGVTITGRWLIDEAGMTPGPGLGRCLAEVRKRVEAGALASLDEVRALADSSRG